MKRKKQNYKPLFNLAKLNDETEKVIKFKSKSFHVENLDQAIARKPLVTDPSECWRCFSGKPPEEYGLCRWCLAELLGRDRPKDAAAAGDEPTP